MKALNTTRWVRVKYPRDTPRISRKRLWYDRSEWRQDPQVNLEGGSQLIDHAMHGARDQGELQQTNYKDLHNLANRAGRVGLKKF